MKKFLLAFILFFFLFPTTAKASCSFSEQFCEDYGIESYEELEEIYTIYSAALDYGMNSYSMVEDAIISDYILKEELGEDLVDELLDFQEQYGYDSIEKLLNVADEIGYSELTEDYSYIHSEYEESINSSDINKTYTKYTFTDKLKDKLCEFWDNFGFFIILCIVSLIIMCLSYIVYEFYQRLKKKHR